VNSSHHQAVGRVASALQLVGVSPDGIIEALELAPGASNWLPYLISVQFHPERLVTRHPEFLELFRSLVRACRKERKVKV
jgi:putative glutamine amidotransferase